MNEFKTWKLAAGIALIGASAVVFLFANFVTKESFSNHAADVKEFKRETKEDLKEIKTKVLEIHTELVVKKRKGE